jgi:hypothetical protein
MEEHLSTRMCLELIYHAELAVGEEMLPTIKTEMRQKLAEDQPLPLHYAAEHAELLVAVLVLKWDQPVQALCNSVRRMTDIITNNLVRLMGLEDKRNLHYLDLRTRTLFAMQCRTLLTEMIYAKQQRTGPPTAEFFHRVLPRLCCDTRFESLLTPGMLRVCPDMW